MSLQSRLFGGDPKLEAAAISDPAHIVPGATGAHVGKIQVALFRLDGAVISPDEVKQTSYGPSTSRAVLAYKQKRNIVNRTYQSQADAIVGKMTMASLDSDVATLESRPRVPVQVTPLSFSRVSPPRSLSLVSLVNSSEAMSFGVAGSAVTGGPTIVSGPSFLPNTILELRRNSSGSILVTGGAFGELTVADPDIVKVTQQGPPDARAPILTDAESFRIVSGTKLGRTTITASTLRFADGSASSLDVVVKTFLAPAKFVEGVNHAHTPSGQYAAVRANPNSDLQLNVACQFLSASPQGLVDLAINFQFKDKPIALKHLNFYLKDGKGADFVEDANIKDWLTRDSGIKKRLKREIFSGPGRKPRAEGHFTFEQSEFADDTAGQDFRFAFGAIDRVDFEVDFSQDTVRVFFKDRYEWHPFYPFYTNVGPTAQFPTSGDGPRGTNCLHAALVELKTSGAADFWMKGQAEVALSQIVGP